MSKDLNLILTYQWYDRHLADKHEDYRNITPYWAKRLCSNYNKECKDKRPPGMSVLCIGCLAFVPKRFKTVILHKGYSSQISTKEHQTTTIGIGNLDWGASDKAQFIIKLK